MQDLIMNKLISDKIVAIMRGVPPNQAVQTVSALLEGGIRCVEVTFDQKGEMLDTLRSLEMIASHFEGSVALGAGTVLNIEQVNAAASAGAGYIISPNVDEVVISHTKERGLVSIPGAMTPTEAVAAKGYGADIVKLFPAGILGAAYIKALLGPLSHIPVMAVGGITPENLNGFFESGAVGVGIGGNLVNNKLIKENNFDEIKKLALQYKII